MKYIQILIFLFLIITDLPGQINKFGMPVMKNYSAQTTKGTEYNYSIVKDRTGVVYLGNDNRGVIRFDGHTWSLIPVRKDPVVRVLCLSKEGVVYVGGTYEFGYIEGGKNGTPVYVSLAQRLEEQKADTTGDKENKSPVTIGDVYSIVEVDSLVYFVSLESMIIYNTINDNLRYVNLRKYDLNQVVKVVKVGNRIFLADNMNGIYELKNDVPVQVPGGEKFAMKISLVIMPYDENTLFIGTLTDGVFTLDLNTGKVSSGLLDPALNESLKAEQLYVGIENNAGEKLLGTLTNGIYILDKEFRLKGKWDTKTTDMADNTITALCLGDGPSPELWIATAGFVTKAYVGLPFYEISPRAGYDGLLNSIASFDNRIYLGTDVGLYRSTTNQQGQFAFESFGNYSYQFFTVRTAENDNEKFLLAGSNQGLFQIKKDGRMIKIDDIIKYPEYFKTARLNVRSVLQSKGDRNKYYLGLNSKGIIVAEYSKNSWKFIRQIKTNIKGYVLSMIENRDGDLFLFTGSPVGLFRISPADTIPYEFKEADGLQNIVPTNLTMIGNEVVASTTTGLIRYNPETKKWSPFNELLGGFSRDLYCRDIVADEEGDIWLTTQEDRIYEILFKKDSLALTPHKGPLNVLPNLEKYDFKYLDGLYWMTKSKNIYIIDKKKILERPPDLNVLLTRILLGTDSLFMNGSFCETLPNGKRIPSFTDRSATIPEIKYNFNSISFSWTLPYYVEEEGTVFRYRLDGFDKTWSKWEKTYYKDFTNLPFGKYTFRVMAKTANSLETRESLFEFYILKPWYLKSYMIILYILVIILFIILLIKAYTRKLKNENIRLEGIVAERTAVVVKQKEELESSIHYASRIQMALLPSEAILSENLRNYFILFKPRDIVSGDFYWMTKKENRLYIVAADCTGHGVPGAFMSLLGMSFLDEIIDKENSPRADYILSELRLHVTESLKQSGGDDEAKDGMDMSLLVIDFNVSRIEFSGAYNPCFRVRKLTEKEALEYREDNSSEMPDGSMSNGKYLLETIYASKMPIGISSRMDEKFVFYDWELEKGVSYYLFSDGYIDQFGGQSGRKFMKKNFKRLLLDIQDYPMNRQKELLDQNLKDWMGQSPQIDDILVMGIRTD